MKFFLYMVRSPITLDKFRYLWFSKPTHFFTCNIYIHIYIYSSYTKVYCREIKGVERIPRVTYSPSKEH